MNQATEAFYRHLRRYIAGEPALGLEAFARSATRLGDGFWQPESVARDRIHRLRTNDPSVRVELQNACPEGYRILTEDKD